MQTFGSLTSAAVLGTLMLSGCGSSEDEFCDAFDSFEVTLDPESGQTARDSLDEVDRMVDNAPGDVQDDVGVLADYGNAFREAAADTGLEPEDLQSLETLKSTALTDALDELGIDEEDTAEARADIEEWVEENCEQ